MTHGESLRVIWGKRIREARKRRDLSVVGLARLVGLHPSGVSRIERGTQGMSDETKLAFAAALDEPVGELFAYPDEIREAS